MATTSGEFFKRSWLFGHLIRAVLNALQAFLDVVDGDHGDAEDIEGQVG